MLIKGTADDHTNIASGRYDVTKTRLPYAIELQAGNFDYPIEGLDITLAYLHFTDWAQSGGTLYSD